MKTNKFYYITGQYEGVEVGGIVENGQFLTSGNIDVNCYMKFPTEKAAADYLAYLVKLNEGLSPAFQYVINSYSL